MQTKMMSPISSWDEDAARHVLSRSVFGFSREDVEFALSHSLDDFIDNYLLAPLPAPEPPGPWAISTTITVDYQYFLDMTYWWYELMLDHKYSLCEKMVLFWHSHFTTQYSKVYKMLDFLKKLFQDMKICLASSLHDYQITGRLNGEKHF